MEGKPRLISQINNAVVGTEIFNLETPSLNNKIYHQINKIFEK